MIESALSWLGDLARFLGSTFPRLLVVQSSHRAVKYKNGHTPILLAPGRHLYWPLMSPIEYCPVVRQVISIPTQLLETADDQTVAASGVLEFEIQDAILFLAQTESGWEAVRAVGSAAIRRVVMKQERAALCDAPEAIDLRLTRQAQRWLQAYGVKVLRLRLADFARVRAVHLSGRPGSLDHLDAPHVAE
jgi:regulator of protease activity HflC (stomatin/prohibitin superfamily)